MSEGTIPEPWLRGTLTDVAAVPRVVLHSMELAREDILRWCGGLSDAELNARPEGLAPVAFHIRHIVRSVDRLLSYAEGKRLDDSQIALLKSEMDGGATRDELFAELDAALVRAAVRIRQFDAKRLEEPRPVGTKLLP